MSAYLNEIQVQDIDHLGIVARIVDEIGLVEQVNELLGRVLKPELEWMYQ